MKTLSLDVMALCTPFRGGRPYPFVVYQTGATDAADAEFQAERWARFFESVSTPSVSNVVGYVATVEPFCKECVRPGRNAGRSKSGKRKCPTCGGSCRDLGGYSFRVER